MMAWPGRGRRRWETRSKGRQDVRRTADGVTVKEESYTLKEKSVFILLIFSLVHSFTALLVFCIRWLLQSASVWFSEPEWN